MKGIVGKKLGLAPVFDPETGEVTPVTVIEAGPCPIVRVKTVDSDGYEAVQLAFDPVAERKVTKARLGQLGQAGPHRRLVEFRGTTELTVGEPVTVETFEPGDRVKVSGIGIGKGFAGTIKRHHFSRGPKSHGSHNIRQPGSIGAAAYPARVFKGSRMSGHRGARQVTQRGLQVIDRDSRRNLLLVRGAVPGAVNGIVIVRPEGRRSRS